MPGWQRGVEGTLPSRWDPVGVSLPSPAIPEIPPCGVQSDAIGEEVSTEKPEEERKNPEGLSAGGGIRTRKGLLPGDFKLPADVCQAFPSFAKT